DADSSNAKTSGHRISGSTNTRQDTGLQREHVPLQESGLRLLPHAVRRLYQTDSVRQPDDDRVSQIGGISSRQADSAAIHVFTQIPGTPVQRSTEPVLWRKLLGCTLDRVPAAESRRRAGTASSGRYPGTCPS